MKRPVPFYFVAAWCFLALEYQTGLLLGQLKSHVREGQIPENLWPSLRLLVFILVIWHIVRLVQLRAFNRWSSIVFFTWWTAMMIGNGLVIFLSLYDRLHQPFRLMLFLLTCGVLNIASAMYLARRSFREFAVQFVAERKKERNSQMMQKASEKKIASDLRS